MKKIALLLFVLVSIAELLTHVFEIGGLHHVVKPLIMPLLGMYYFYSVKWNGLTALVLLAIFFSFLGDSFLMYDHLDPLYFMLGLGAFLIAHIFYAVAYGKFAFYSDNDALSNIQMVRMALPVLMAGTGLVVILYPVLGELRVPVVVYALVLMVMVLRALFRYKKTTAQSFILVFAGAVLFMISDSMIAISKFLQPIDGAGFLIMITYIAGQAMIIQGLANHAKAFNDSPQYS